MRKIELTGRLAADAERKISKNGNEYITFRIGNNEFIDKDEQGNQRTYWFSITVFNQRYFGLAQYLTKGKYVIVEGDYSDRLYKNNEGNCEIGRDIVANAIYFVSDGTNKQANTNTQSQTSPSTQTTMTPKPTTAEIEIPQKPVVETESGNDNEDDLPF